MPITEKEYFQLKEYWDYQRKVEYNRELTYEKMSLVWALHEVDIMFDTVWNAVSPKMYLDPPSNYVPENPTLRLDGEDIEKWRAIPHRFIPKEEYRKEYE